MFKRTPKFLKRFWQWAKSHRLKFGIILALIFFSLLFLPKRIIAIIKGPEAKYEIYTVKKTDLKQTISASGKVKAENQVELKFQTSGLLTWIGVKEGDQVKKWQAIASLDRRELEKNLIKTLRDYSKERNDFEEDRQITYKDEIIDDTIKRILEKNQWDLDKAVLDVELKDIAIKLATLVTPIEGIVTNIDTPLAGINITPATATFTVADPKTMLFEAEVDEADIAQVQIGQKVIIKLDAYPDQEFSSQVGWLGFQSVTTKGGGTAFKLKANLAENQDLKFKSGMNGDMEIIINQKVNTFVIPNQAISQIGDQSQIKVLQGRQIKEIPVKTGLVTDTQTEIIEGLTEDIRVIVSEKK